MLKFYNTLTRKLEEFQPIKPNEVGMYSCGPTVYGNQHIGHVYAYTQYDALVRFLKYSGYQVKWVMNITDVGHMTSDEDAGEDKMEKGAKREGLTPWQIADKYLAQFIQSLDSLNINRPDVLCRATEHIEDQINLIKKIEANGFIYKTQTGVVFDTSKFPGYADFAKLDLSKQAAGARVEVDKEKKNPWDFLLWITNQPTHIMLWDSPWGKGFPGWHIECTAMSTKYLGETFDIHTGGKEHIPIHHTNEVAQAFGAFGRQTANYWLHNEWLTMNGEKMSKSLGNVILVTDLAERGFDPMHLRYLFLTSHYRTGINFTWESLEAAKTAYERLINILTGWRKGESREALSEDKLNKIDEYRENFIKVLNDDFNIPAALALVWEVVKSNIPDTDKYDLIMDFDTVLGLKLKEKSVVEENIPTEVQVLAEQRQKFRVEKQWSESDRVRGEIEKLGYQIKDTPAGYLIKKMSN